MTTDEEYQEFQAFQRLSLDSKLYRIYQGLQCVKDHEDRIKKLERVAIALTVLIMGASGITWLAGI